jgi:hypothetical protein
MLYIRALRAPEETGLDRPSPGTIDRILSLKQEKVKLNRRAADKRCAVSKAGGLPQQECLEKLNTER